MVDFLTSLPPERIAPRFFPELTLSYDVENRLAQASTTSMTNRFGYDLDNRQVYTNTPGSTVESIIFYGAFGERLKEYTLQSGNYQASHWNLYFDGKLIWQDYKITPPANGGIQGLQDRLGSRMAYYLRYYPFGEGQVPGRDFATYLSTPFGIDYAHNRYYASNLGRFTTPDPFGGSASLGNPQSWNRYAYVGNDPVNKNDPSGLDFYYASPGVDSSLAYLNLWWVYSNPMTGMFRSVSFDSQLFAAEVQNKYIRNAVGNAHNILAGDNECSKWFGSSASMALGALSPILQPGPVAAGPGPSNVGIRMIVPETAEGPFRLPTRATVNISGPFLTPFGPSFGDYKAGTSRSQTLQILHELAHLVKGTTGDWLIPDDGASAKQSETNTATVMEHCKNEIDKIK